MDDLISRQAAIDALDMIGSVDTDADRKYAMEVFMSLPSAQPEYEELDFVQPHKKLSVSLQAERKKGRFVGTRYEGWVCSVCNVLFEDDPSYYNYCPNCGWQMER